MSSILDRVCIWYLVSCIWYFWMKEHFYTRYEIPATPSVMHTAELRVLLEEMGKRPNKRLGQNFLIDASVVHSALEAGGVQKGDLILEVGPGLGVLTEALLEQGADVIAIEKDRAFADRLASLHSEDDSRLRVVEGDAAELDWSNILDPRPWKFIANIPYSITSLLLRKALWCPRPPSLGVVLIQKEVAERCMGCFKKDGDMSLLSLMIGLSCSSARIVRNVPSRCFYPAPKVDSAILAFTSMSPEERLTKWGIDPEEVMKVAKAGFAHPRKLLASNLGRGASPFVKSTSGDRQGAACPPLLRAGDSRRGRGTEKAEVEKILVSLGLNPKVRAEELSIDQWAELAKGMS